MRVPVLLCVLVLSTLFGKSQQTQSTSNLLLGYQEFPTTICGHAADSSGNQYFTGQFRGQLTVNNQVLGTGNGLEDIFWVKTDSAGKVLRYTSFGSAYSETAFPGALALDDNSHMLYGFQFLKPFNVGSLNLAPYIDTLNGYTSGLVYSDTAGTVSWATRTNLLNLKIYCAGSVFHVFGYPSYSTKQIKVGDSVVVDSISPSMLVHLMFNGSGKLLGVKTITTVPGGAVYLVNVDFFSDKSLLLNVFLNSNTSFNVNKNVVPLPATNSGYMLLIKTDTAYKNFTTKLLNPQKQGMVGLGAFAFPVCVGPEDSVYSIINYQNYGTSLVLDGFAISPQYNTLAIFDSSLVLKRVAVLGTSSVGVYPGNVYKRRIFIKSMIYQRGQLFFNGAYTGTNESPINVIPRRDTVIKMLPDVLATIDQNGPSTNFVGKIDIRTPNNTLFPASYRWYGDNHEYEYMTMGTNFFHRAGKDRFAFYLNMDNVWNPWIVDSGLNVISGRMQRNADMPETPQLVQYFDDGSRLVIGYASGRTALDSSASYFVTNALRRDVFMVRLGANDKVLWYKRFFSTLPSVEIRDLQIRNNKAWFLVNYGYTVNDSNYVRIDNTLYSVGATASVLGNIDTSGAISVISLNNSLLKLASFRDFGFFNNGDLAVVTPSSLLQAGFANSNPGIHIFRVQPSTGNVIDKIKITGAPPPSVSSVRIDKNDHLYLFNGEGNILQPYTMNLYNPTSLVDSMRIDVLSGQQCSLLKMDWNHLKWLKRSSGAGVGSSGQTGNLYILNEKPVISFHINPVSQSVYWDGKLVSYGFPWQASAILDLDSNGSMQRSKVIEQYSLVYGKAGSNNKLYVSGALFKAITVDTIQVGFGGNLDGLSLVLDTTLTAKKIFRVASPFFENMLDMDLFKDSIAALAYSAQGSPQLYTNRVEVNTSDYEQDAYLGTVITRTSLVTSVNTVPQPNSFLVAPNPVRDGVLRFVVGVNEMLRSTYAIYQSSGQHLATGLLQLTPGSNNYSIVLPAPVSKGVYHVVVSNKKWTTTKTFVVL